MKASLQRELYSRNKVILDKVRYKGGYENYAIPKYGIQCNNGWFSLIDDFLEEIDKVCKPFNKYPIFVQIKEKFGHLRVYYTYTDIEDLDIKLDEITELYINKSKFTCEVCGAFGDIKPFKNGFAKCICDKCITNYN